VLAWRLFMVAAAGLTIMFTNRFKSSAVAMLLVVSKSLSGVVAPSFAPAHGAPILMADNGGQFYSNSTFRPSDGHTILSMDHHI
jgi:hypothetical protein